MANVDDDGGVNVGLQHTDRVAGGTAMESIWNVGQVLRFIRMGTRTGFHRSIT